MNNEWRSFFDGQAEEYHQEPYVRHTVDEVDFLIEELGLKPGDRLLDVGCGVGRHALELARRGYQVTAFDLSLAMLKQAQDQARQDDLALDLFQADAVFTGLAPLHDAAISLCEGAFGLLAGSADPLHQPRLILEGINRGLKPGAPLLLTAPNGLAKIRQASQDQVQAGDFDPIHLVERFEIELEGTEGLATYTLHEKGFVPSELILLASAAGFEPLALWGGTAGGWQRQRPDLGEMEIMLVARKLEAGDRSSATMTRSSAVHSERDGK